MEDTPKIIKAWKLEKKHKNWREFVKSNFDSNMVLDLTEGYGICVSGKDEARAEYVNDLCVIDIKLDATAEELGQMVVDAFSKAEEIYYSSSNESNRDTIELLCEEKLSYIVPQDDHFCDAQDYGAAEIYQGYSYCPNDDEESVAEFYFSIAAELDCNISEESIKASWVCYEGAADSFEVRKADHPVFEVRAEMSNKFEHRISYYKQISETELLECHFELQNPHKRKKLDNQLTASFEALVKSCRWQKE